MARSLINASFQFFPDPKTVKNRVRRKKLRVLSRVGAYARGVIRNFIRPQKTTRKTSKLAGRDGRVITVDGEQVFVPMHGKVLDAKTLRPVTREAAEKAHGEIRRLRRVEGGGKPPRRGPTDNLRKFTLFGLDPSTESVVVGVLPFSRQPRLVGAVSVPELLDEGGGEYIGNQLVQYEPRPYITTALPKAEAKFAELIEQVKL